MGYAIAAAALEAKHEVILISGPVALTAPLGAEIVRVTTGEEMFEAAAAHFTQLRCLRDVRRGLRLQAGTVRTAENEKAAADHFRSRSSRRGTFSPA